MVNLFHFLTDLAIEPRKQVAFAQNADLIMEVAGLTGADKAVIKSAEKDKISAVFANEFTVLAVGCLEPGPDPLPDPDPPSPPDPEKES